MRYFITCHEYVSGSQAAGISLGQDERPRLNREGAKMQNVRE